MTQKKLKKDPHAKREAKNYDNPIASREFILSILNQHDTALKVNKLATLLNIETDEQFKALQFRLGAMVRDQQITQTRKGGYLRLDSHQTVSGTVMAHKDGFGFLIPDDKTPDIYLSNREMRKVFDGDNAKVAITYTSKTGKLEGDIIEVTQHNTTTLVGRIIQDKGTQRLLTDNPKIQHTVIIDDSYSFTLDKDDIVLVSITRQPELRHAPRGIIKEVLGQSMDPGIEIEIATRNFSIPFEWPDAVLQEVDKLSDTPAEADKKKRIDCRHLPFVTIDGEDARDFDDAVYCEPKKSGGWRLWVAIADVSHYVGINSPLDKEAQVRGTSVYFPEKVIPMLPEKISNGLCSLMPNIDRLCMVCEMTISAKGRLSSYKFYESVMHSRARLTYDQVGQMLTETPNKPGALRQKYSAIIDHIDELNRLYHVLRNQREGRGAIDFDTVETRMVFNDQRKIEAIVPVIRNDAHRIIEECMLCANVASARFLEKHQLSALFRVHDGPSEKKLSNLREYLGELGLSLPGGNKPDSADYQALVAAIAHRDDADLIQTMILRSMSQASYEADNRGHFGLAYTAYTHFTSPIRRYPDLLVHRAIRSVIRSDKVTKAVKRAPTQKKMALKKIYPYSDEELIQLGEHCSMTERRADEATRDVVNWLKCEYLAEFTGQQYTGIITAVTGFGFFVELTDLYIEGLVHISQLDNDYFHFEAKMQRLIGEHSRKVYRLGDKMTVLISKVDLDERRIHLTPASGAKSEKKPKKKTAVKKTATGNKSSTQTTTKKTTSNKKKKVKSTNKTGKLRTSSSRARKKSR